MIAPNPAPAVSSWLDLLAVLRATGLLTDAQLAEAAAAVPAHARTAADAATALVAAGMLTRFQADRLLAGKKDGYALGQYVILDQIGKGPVARVYKARHRAMNRLVAVKFFSAAQTRDPARRAAFEAEARAAARLAHPNVLTVLDANRLGERFYLVVEYVDGAGADAIVRQSGPLPAARACEIARQAALGLQHAHEKGVVHGGLTAGCLLVGRPGGTGPADRPGVKVANFGLGRLIDPTGADFLPASDPADYRAPELADGAPPSPRSDLYSLGAVLSYLLTGRPPGRGDAAPVERVPPAVAGLVRELLAADPAARPASAAEAAERLAPFAESDDPAAQIDFNLPAGGMHPGSRQSGSLSAFAPPPTEEDADTSPWAGLGDGPTQDDTAPMSALTARAGRPRSRGRMAAVALAAATTLGLALAVGARVIARVAAP